MVKAVQFSGGKDSLACLYLYRDDPEAVVLYADSGAAVPHVRRYVLETTQRLGMRLHIVSPEIPVDAWQDANGLPADILPVDASPLMRKAAKEPYKATLVPYPVCCEVNLWQPMQQGVADLGANIVVRGSKACDPKIGVPDGYTENGITYLSPLWNWSDEDVFAYLNGMGAELPPQYAMGADSLDCWCCTAYLALHGKARFEYLKNNYPDLYAKAKARLDAVRDTVRAGIADTPLEL